MIFSKQTQYSIESTKPEASYLLANEFKNMVNNCTSSFEEIIILCIGTDRSTGDCLGPLVGDKLSKEYMLNKVNIFGTLNEPVHAKNIVTSMDFIYKNFKNPIIIAIDASLGKFENIGKINLRNGPLFPGAGVNKNINPVGDISITGIVNCSGFMEYIVLQNTRLSIVMQMADTISLALYMSLKNLMCNNSVMN